MGPRGAWESARNDGQAYRQQHRCRRHRGGEALLTRLHQLRGLSGAKALKSRGRHIKSRHYMGERSTRLLGCF